MGPRENRTKKRPNSQAQKTPLRKSHPQLISMRLMCNHGMRFCRKPRLQNSSQFRVMENLVKTAKSAIYSNSSQGGPRKSRSKSRPNSQAQNTPWRKSHPQFISMRLMWNHRTAFCSKPWLQKCQRQQNGLFFEILQRGDKRKIAQKVGRTRRLQKHPVANFIIN